MENNDNWNHRSKGMYCSTCMWFIVKVPDFPDTEIAEVGSVISPRIGRCRRHAPTMNGWPVMFESDWCGSHKLDENKI